MKMTFLETELINPFFYNPLINKSQEKLEFLIEELGDLFGIEKSKISPLQYTDPETKNYIKFPRVFKLKFRDGTLKVRSSDNESEANRLLERADFASSLGVPMSVPLGRKGRFSVFEYLEGDSLSSEESFKYVSTIASVQALMNSVVFGRELDERVAFLTSKMIDDCFWYLRDKGVDIDLLKRVESNLDYLNIRATFDHQDYGIHNIIIDTKGNIRVVDEEAFGIIPLGYGIVRPVYGRINYRVVENGNPEDYFNSWDGSLRDYLIKNLGSMRALFILRNSVRRFMVNNELGARNLLEEANGLK